LKTEVQKSRAKHLLA